MAFRLQEPGITTMLTLLLSFSGQSVALDSTGIKARDFIDACRLLSESAATADNNEPAPQTNLCLVYIQGFFAGTDDVVFQSELPSNYTLRVLRTRGLRLSEYHEKLLDSPYCLSEDTSVIDLADKIATSEKEFSETAEAREVIEFILHEHHPCERE